MCVCLTKRTNFTHSKVYHDFMPFLSTLWILNRLTRPYIWRLPGASATPLGWGQDPFPLGETEMLEWLRMRFVLLYKYRYTGEKENNAECVLFGHSILFLLQSMLDQKVKDLCCIPCTSKDGNVWVEHCQFQFKKSFCECCDIRASAS